MLVHLYRFSAVRTAMGLSSATTNHRIVPLAISSSSNQLTMSSIDNECLLAILSVVSTALASLAFRFLLSTSSALLKLRDTPEVRVADLRSILKLENPADSSCKSFPIEGKLMIVRGTVAAKSSVDTVWARSRRLLGWKSVTGAVITERIWHTKKLSTEIVDDKTRESGDDIASESLDDITKEFAGKTLISQIPFVLVNEKHSHDYVIVNTSGSSHPLPLTNTYRYEWSVPEVSGIYQIKLLPIGEEVSAIGLCTIEENGKLEINSCEDMPYFLSEMSKDQMMKELTCKTRKLLWCSVILGTASICSIIAYVLARKQNRRRNKSCVRCRTRDRRYAFVPCGHLLYCVPCFLSTKHWKCRVCGKLIYRSLGIYVT